MQNIHKAFSNKSALCHFTDLVPDSGICAIGDQQEQIALFYLPDENPTIYAVSNWDPIGQANVISRGIVGDIKGQLVVASPLYKQHFNLVTGACVEDESQRLRTYQVVLDNDKVYLFSEK